MPSPKLILSLLFVACFSLSAAIEQWWVGWEGNRAEESLLELTLGDGRRLFARHFYFKADAYFHSGFYPSIFDAPLDEGHGEEAVPAMAQDAGATQGKRKELPGPGAPRDWIEAFGRNFYPSEHTHLDMGGSSAHDHEHDHDHDHGAGPASDEKMIREILPWLKMSAKMDPEHIETYTVSAYWLRTRMGKAEEAEELLGEGLRANPDSYEILFELGRIYDARHQEMSSSSEDKAQAGQNRARARQLWARALRKWREQETGRPVEERNYFMLSQVCSHLAFLEEQAGDLLAAIGYSTQWREAVSDPAAIQRRIDLLVERLKKEEAKADAKPVVP